MHDDDYEKVLEIVKAWVKKAGGPVETYNRELLHHVFLLMANTGMRTGEIFQLKNSDIQEISKPHLEVVINIRAETIKTRGKRKEDRRLTIMPSFGGRKEGGTPINYLIRWIDRYQVHHDPNDYIFSLYTKGSKVASDPFYRGYMSLRQDLATQGLEWWDAYHCRHHYGTMAIKAGHSLAAISNAMGNSPEVLTKVYSHLLSQMTSRDIASRRVIRTAGGSEVVERTLRP